MPVGSIAPQAVEVAARRCERGDWIRVAVELYGAVLAESATAVGRFEKVVLVKLAPVALPALTRVIVCPAGRSQDGRQFLNGGMGHVECQLDRTGLRRDPRARRQTEQAQD